MNTFDIIYIEKFNYNIQFHVKERIRIMNIVYECHNKYQKYLSN